MSEPCLEPCPAHLCLELTKAGMCRHEVACLRADVERLTRERDEERALVERQRAAARRAGEHLIRLSEMRDRTVEQIAAWLDARASALAAECNSFAVTIADVAEAIRAGNWRSK